MGEKKLCLHSGECMPGPESMVTGVAAELMAQDPG